MRPAPAALYVAQLALLATHQADAAAQREWEVFGVPGGLPFFLAFNLVAVAVLGHGLRRVAEGAPSARGFERLCAGVGLFTVAIHAVFLALDPVAFHAPLSLALFAAIGLVAAAQLAPRPPA